MPMPHSSEPAYPLTEIQRLVRRRRYAITRRAGRDAEVLGFDEWDIVECVLATRGEQFHKNMPSQTCPGTYQDVYYTVWGEVPIYLKLQIGPGGAVVISFHRDDSHDYP